MGESGTGEDDLLVVLHAVRIKGVASLETTGAFTGLPVDEVEVLLDRLGEEGQVRQRQGRVSGYFLTGPGRETHQRLLAAEVVDGDLETLYSAFMDKNAALKAECTKWQLSTRAATPDSHLSAEEIQEVLSWARPLHLHVKDAVETCAPKTRFARYPHRLADALDRVAAGQREAMLKPMSDSFHDVWMELHQDLLLSLGRERGEADGY